MEVKFRGHNLSVSVTGTRGVAAWQRPTYTGPHRFFQKHKLLPSASSSMNRLEVDPQGNLDHLALPPMQNRRQIQIQRIKRGAELRIAPPNAHFVYGSFRRSALLNRTWQVCCLSTTNCSTRTKGRRVSWLDCAPRWRSSRKN